MKRSFFCFSVFASLVACAAPVVSNVSLVQDEVTRDVKVTYDLSGDDVAIVTFSMFTNGVQLAPVCMTHVRGDVNKLVAKGAGRELYWRPREMGDASLSSATVQVRAWATNAPPPYMVQDMLAPYGRTYYESAEYVPGGVQDRIYKTNKMVFRLIPAKDVTFTMGSPGGESGRKTNEDFHEVTLRNDFYLGIYPVTQGQFMRVVEISSWLRSYMIDFNPGSFSNEVDSALFPVDHMSGKLLRNNYPSINSYDVRTMEQSWLWHFNVNCMTYSGPLASTQYKADLPSEAEWEFACRAGRADARNADGDVDDIAWHSGNSGGVLHPVGEKKPNDWGLYDMLGGVWEVCRDGYAANLGTAAADNPFTGSNYGGFHVKRGGSMWEDSSYARSASRSLINTHNFPMGGNVSDGFRVMIPVW